MNVFAKIGLYLSCAWFSGNVARMYGADDASTAFVALLVSGCLSIVLADLGRG